MGLQHQDAWHVAMSPANIRSIVQATSVAFLDPFCRVTKWSPMMVSTARRGAFFIASIFRGKMPKTQVSPFLKYNSVLHRLVSRESSKILLIGRAFWSWLDLECVMMRLRLLCQISPQTGISIVLHVAEWIYWRLKSFRVWWTPSCSLGGIRGKAGCYCCCFTVSCLRCLSATMPLS